MTDNMRRRKIKSDLRCARDHLRGARSYARAGEQLHVATWKIGWAIGDLGRALKWIGELERDDG